MSSVSERLLENEISAHLVEHGGYLTCKVGIDPEWRQDFDPKVGLDTVELFAFIELTQGTDWGNSSRRTAAGRTLRVRDSCNGSHNKSTSVAQWMLCVTVSATRTLTSDFHIASRIRGCSGVGRPVRCQPAHGHQATAF